MEHKKLSGRERELRKHLICLMRTQSSWLLYPFVMSSPGFEFFFLSSTIIFLQITIFSPASFSWLFQQGSLFLIVGDTILKFSRLLNVLHFFRGIIDFF